MKNKEFTKVYEGLQSLIRVAMGDSVSNDTYFEFKKYFRYPGELLERMEQYGYGSADDYLLAIAALRWAKNRKLDISEMCVGTQLEDFLKKAEEKGKEENDLLLLYSVICYENDATEITGDDLATLLDAAKENTQESVVYFLKKILDDRIHHWNLQGYVDKFLLASKILVLKMDSISSLAQEDVCECADFFMDLMEVSYALKHISEQFSLSIKENMGAASDIILVFSDLYKEPVKKSYEKKLLEAGFSNMDILNLNKDLQKLQKYDEDKEKYLYTTNNIDLSLFYNHTYTFPEFLSISPKNRKLIEIYNSLDPSMRVDEKLRRIRQLFHESIRMDNFPEDLISAVAKTLSKEPLSDYINRHSYLKETASISDFLYLESIESYNPGLKEVINEITGRIDILAVVNNYNNPKLKELGLKDFKNAYVSLDEDSAWLKEELPIPEEHQKSFLEFCLQGNASVTKSYYDDQYEKGQKNVLLLAKAAVYGKLDEVKYENFNAEIGFTLTGDQKEVWKENSKKQQYGLKATENTDFESCMKIGAVPTWTCMNYKSGQYNECLLSVFDANKKVLYVDKGSKCVARAIMRLTKMSDTAVNKTLSFRDVAEDAAMESGSDEKLVIFLERMYFSHLTNAEIIQVRKLLYDLAEAKATALGAKILVAQDYEDITEEKLLKKTSTNVYISKSKNGDQYLDSLGGDCEKGGYYVKGNFYAPYEQ